MKVTVIPIVVGALATVSKILEKRLGEPEMKGRIETINITALLKEESGRLEKTCNHWKTTNLNWHEKSPQSIIIIIIIIIIMGLCNPN